MFSSGGYFQKWNIHVLSCDAARRGLTQLKLNLNLYIAQILNPGGVQCAQTLIEALQKFIIPIVQANSSPSVAGKSSLRTTCVHAIRHCKKFLTVCDIFETSR